MMTALFSIMKANWVYQFPKNDKKAVLQKYKNKFVRGTDWNLSGYLLHWSTGALSQNDIGSYASCDQPRAVKINAFSVLNLH